MRRKLLSSVLVVFLLATTANSIITLAAEPTLNIRFNVAMGNYTEYGRNAGWSIIPNSTINVYRDDILVYTINTGRSQPERNFSVRGNYYGRFVSTASIWAIENELIYGRTHIVVNPPDPSWIAQTTGRWEADYIGIRYEEKFHIGYFDGVNPLTISILIELIQPPTEQSAPPNEISVTLKETPVEFDVPPMIVNDRTMVPFRAIFEAFGMNVEWNDDTRTAIGYVGDWRMELTIDSYTAYVDGHPTTLDSPAMIYGGRTLVPVRFIAEATGANVDWNPETQTVIIQK